MIDQPLTYPVSSMGWQCIKVAHNADPSWNTGYIRKIYSSKSHGVSGFAPEQENAAIISIFAELREEHSILLIINFLNLVELLVFPNQRECFFDVLT